MTGSKRREKIGGGRRRGDTTRRCKGKGGKTWDPSAPMGQRELRWGSRDRDPGGRVRGRVRVSTPVGEGLRWRGRGESGSRGESWAAAERRTRGSGREGHTRCSCREEGRNNRGRKGGKGEKGGTRCSCRERVTSRGRG